MSCAIRTGTIRTGRLALAGLLLALALPAANHALDPDDVAGMRVIYGPVAIPVPISPAAGVALGLLLAALGARESIRKTS